MNIPIEIIVLACSTVIGALVYVFQKMMSAFSKNTEAFNSINSSIQDIRLWITQKDTADKYEEKLQKYRDSKRLWQGIPSIEVTKRGRIFLTFYSGGVKEEIGNYVIVIKSDDGGNHFSEPIVIVKEDNGRCFDPCLCGWGGGQYLGASVAV